MGFKLRSGNGPLPFKQMGSSPAKQSASFSSRTSEKNKDEASTDWWESSPGVDKTDLTKSQVAMVNKNRTKAGNKNLIETQEQKAVRVKEKQDYNTLQETAKTTKGTKEYKAEQGRIAEEKAAKTKADAEAKAKVDATRGTEEGQVKKAAKIEKLKAKEEKRNVKRESGKKVFLGNLKTAMNKSKTDRLQKEVDMTPDEYKANEKRKRQEIGDALVDAGAGLRNVGTNKSIMEGMEESKRSRESYQQTKKDADRNALRTDLNNKIKQRQVDDYDAALKDENKLPETNKYVSSADAAHAFYNKEEE